MEKDIVRAEGEVRYTVDGQEVVLTPSIVRKYLVRGKGELVTSQELMFFLGICRARQMNPFAADCYLVKYGQDPAAIITSIDFVRARARGQEDCEGWTCGVIVAGKDGKPRDSNGLVLEGEKILGGWCECQPKGWKVPQRLEVNLSGYLKKTSEGKITKFWQPENQPTMISKVAEMQNLRRIWPAALGKMYLNEEVGISDMGEGMNIDMEPGGEGNGDQWKEKPAEADADKFIRLASDNGILGNDLIDLKKFITASASATAKTEEEMVAGALKNFDKFLEIYRRNLQKKREREEMEAKTEKAKKKDEPNTSGPTVAEKLKSEVINGKTGEVFPGPFSESENLPPSDGFVVCSWKNGDEMQRGYCRTNCTRYKNPMECSDYMSESI